MGREDKATWKANYFTKLIVSKHAARKMRAANMASSGKLELNLLFYFTGAFG